MRPSLAYQALTLVLFVLALWLLFDMIVDPAGRYETGFALLCTLVAFALARDRPES